ncbi:MAG: cobyric acid synthase [Clostridia bacterium]|nr:cobyric acid synthase [Clostridia bacterium]
MAKAIMIQGTMSNAGKSLVCAGLCRIFKQDGYKVAPFKSQNMALNSFITNEGLEMGRAQVMQAEAACTEPSVLMNPILLKPTNDVGSQVIVNGEVVGTMDAMDYFAYKKTLRPVVVEAYQKLAAQNDIIVIEGAGSPAEINLKGEDIVNMGMAEIAGAPVLLVGDIDRGGVFACIYGTVALLEACERERIKGIIINKFRGDLEILRPGLSMLENLVKRPVIGVVPYLHLDLDDEDSLSERFTQQSLPKPLDIAVIRLPRISNFTDFNALSRMEPVGLRYVASADELKEPDLIILPGTKNTMGDLMWLRQNGLETAIKKRASVGTPIIGVCGGYQMLGLELSDPNKVEQGGSMRGLELLAVRTVFEPEKVRTRVQCKVLALTGNFAKLAQTVFDGYEIHMGRTVLQEGAVPFAVLANGVKDGAVAGNILGSYVHGLFDGVLGTALVQMLLKQKGLQEGLGEIMSAEAYKNKQYDALAAALRQSLDLPQIYRILEAGLA